MKLNDDELGRVYREGTRRGRHGDCPDSELFQRVLREDVKPTEREILADHLATCADCAEEFRVAGALHRGAPAIATAGARRWIGIAASLLLVSTATVVWWVTRDEPESGRRGEVAVQAGVSPQHRAVVERPPERLSWTGPADSIYRVEVYDVESVPIWNSPRTRESFVDLPTELRDRLRPGDVYHWRVFSEKGIEKSRSDLYRFTLAP